jgi:hypothetical protein
MSAQDWITQIAVVIGRELHNEERAEVRAAYTKCQEYIRREADGFAPAAGYEGPWPSDFAKRWGPPHRERGSAALDVQLLAGILTVRHGRDGDVLLWGPLPEGGWERILLGLLTAAPSAVGPLRDRGTIETAGKYLR